MATRSSFYSSSQAVEAIDDAATLVTAAEAAASAAAASAAEAAASAVDAAAAIDDVYLGSKASNPTTDNEGDALTEGQLYWNSGSNELRIYNGVSWSAYSAASGLLNVSDDTSPTLGGHLDGGAHNITNINSLQVNNQVRINDTDDSHYVGIQIGSNVTADRIFTLTTGDANRTLDISAGSVTISSFGASLVDDTTAAAARTTLELQFTPASASAAASIALHEDTDNGTNKVTLIAPAAIASDKVATLQDVTGTLYISGGTDVAVADGGTGASDASGARTNLELVKTDTAAYLANTSDKVLTTDQVWAAGAEVTLAEGATPNMALFINAVLTLTANRTLAAPSNAKPGQSGYIRIVQGNVGSNTLAYNAVYDFAGGVTPALSTAVGAEDLLFYTVLSSTRIYVTLIKAIA